MRGLRVLGGFVCALALAHLPSPAHAAAKHPHAKPASAEAASDDPDSDKAPSSKTLSPALFKLVNGKSTLYFLGSLHMLPKGFSWHTPALDKAIASADVFYFETNVDFEGPEFHYYMDNHGYLPRGQTLHAMLSPKALTEFNNLPETKHISPERIDYMQPGIAAFMVSMVATVGTQNSVTLVPGVDAGVESVAKMDGKDIGYLESLESQFELFKLMGGGTDVAVLEKVLLDQKKSDLTYKQMFTAWSKGDLVTLGSFEDKDSDPKTRAALLDNRNKAWLPKIEDMATNPKTYFITVGAAHLIGPNGVIEMLCAKHYKVQRLQTGATTPPPACGT